MDFYNQTGKMAIGSRLRQLTDKITADAADIYKLYQIDLQPKWFPVFYALAQGNLTITGIARQIGHSHPSVSKIVAEMSDKGLVTEKKDKEDGRKNMVSLSRKGKVLAEKIKDQYSDVTNAVEAISKEAQHDLWKAIEEWEFLLNRKSLLQYVAEQKKQRESKKVRIIPFKPIYAEAFKKLNEEWISAYFKMEDSDYKALDHPKEYILNKGGAILVALYEDEPVGVCALIKMDDPEYDYELAKMAVSPKVQGKSIGWLLGQAIIEKAKSLGAKKLYLESNTMLKPAINLYYKLGFKKVAGRATPYERCNIQMELEL
ncbi:GNAT family N-acetyltransferase [Flavihumibacter stibioxidans]|uniref:MarR family transcriptional regulator n=1 Tax=Flavihumibacter stibioxidans TaxID=1834163 RepID=A0ABR7MAJ1_9BACT|nr:bifunctional helix-turn-helix transcriptional regulator/GNAT family N-acetyltransferase [Flavihumibacter stibioxidans]MBC6492058.1 MarR family transcriptional regulator [Flavihumibacter stibioxidans]